MSHSELIVLRSTFLTVVDQSSDMLLSILAEADISLQGGEELDDFLEAPLGSVLAVEPVGVLKDEVRAVVENGVVLDFLGLRDAFLHHYFVGLDVTDLPVVGHPDVDLVEPIGALLLNAWF